MTKPQVPATPPSGVRLKLYTRGFKSGPPEQWIYLKMGCGCTIGYPEDSILPTLCPVHDGGIRPDRT